MKDVAGNDMKIHSCAFFSRLVWLFNQELLNLHNKVIGVAAHPQREFLITPEIFHIISIRSSHESCFKSQPNKLKTRNHD
jgi:hypothetical protein